MWQEVVRSQRISSRTTNVGCRCADLSKSFLCRFFAAASRWLTVTFISSTLRNSFFFSCAALYQQVRPPGLLSVYQMSHPTEVPVAVFQQQDTFLLNDTFGYCTHRSVVLFRGPNRTGAPFVMLESSDVCPVVTLNFPIVLGSMGSYHRIFKSDERI